MRCCSRWRSWPIGNGAAIAAAAATAALFAAVSVAAFGWATLLTFLQDLPASRLLIDNGTVPWGGMPSPYVFALSLGGGARRRRGVTGMRRAVRRWLRVAAWRNPAAPFEAKAATLLAGALLVSPFLFTYDLTWAALAAGWLALLGLRTGFPLGTRDIAVRLAGADRDVAGACPDRASARLPGAAVLLLAAVRRAAPLGAPERQRLRRAVEAWRAARWVTRQRPVAVGRRLWRSPRRLLAQGCHLPHGEWADSGDGAQLGGDFINYYAGAKAAASGQAALVYDHDWFHAFEQR